jgi:ribose transport system permease protein
MKYLETPFQFFVYAIAVGIAYQLLMGFIIVYVRIQPIIVALSGYLTLSGLNLMILPRPGGTAPEWMSSWGLGESIWTPVLAILIVATLTTALGMFLSRGIASHPPLAILRGSD